MAPKEDASDDNIVKVETDYKRKSNQELMPEAGLIKLGKYGVVFCFDSVRLAHST